MEKLGKVLSKLEPIDSLGLSSARAIKTMLGKLALHFPQDMGTNEKHIEMRISDYVRLLGKYDPQMVAAACDEWLLKGRFFPKISELVELAEPHYRRAAENAARRQSIETQLAERGRLENFYKTQGKLEVRR